MTFRTALQVIREGLGSHCFVLWLDEGTVTVVKRKQVQADVVVIGKEEDVVWHRNIKYRAKVAAIGAEKDLKEIMKDYVNGLWSLPWERNGEGEEEKSSGDGKDVDNESRRKPKRKIGSDGSDDSCVKKAKRDRDAHTQENSGGDKDKENRRKQHNSKPRKEKPKGGIILVSDHGGIAKQTEEPPTTHNPPPQHPIVPVAHNPPPQPPIVPVAHKPPSQPPIVPVAHKPPPQHPVAHKPPSQPPIVPVAHKPPPQPPIVPVAHKPPPQHPVAHKPPSQPPIVPVAHKPPPQHPATYSILLSSVDSLRSELRAVHDAQAKILQNQEQLLRRVEVLEAQKNHDISDNHEIDHDPFLEGLGLDYSQSPPRSPSPLFSSPHTFDIQTPPVTNHPSSSYTNYTNCPPSSNGNCTSHLYNSRLSTLSGRRFTLSDPSPIRTPHSASGSCYPPPTQCVKVSRRGSRVLDSSSIPKHKLAPPDDIAAANSKLVKPSKGATFSVKLARESFFGDDVLAQCTTLGCREYPGLPLAELQELKEYIFSRLTVYWGNPTEFETLWGDCVGAIGQACARIRRHRNTARSVQVTES